MFVILASLMFDKSIYSSRRSRLSKVLGSGKLLFLGNEQSSKNYAANWYHFIQDSTFLYYFGINNPGLSAYIDIDKGEEILFGDELTIDDIVWTGPLPSLESLASDVGISKVLPSADISKYIDKDTHYLKPYRPNQTAKLGQWTGISVMDIPHRYSRSMAQAIVDQRIIKSDEEVEQMHQACTRSNEMHRDVMIACKPGMKESELVGIATLSASKHNTHYAYEPIMTIKGEVLHNHHYHHTIEEGNMILFDGGVNSEYFYAGDVTRTFPGSKSFTPEQRDVYQIVLDSQRKAISMLAPGVRYIDIHHSAAEVICDGLKQMGIMKGNPQDAVSSHAHTMFFQCGLGHMIGLDVHDMENFGEDIVGYDTSLMKSKEFGLKSLRLGRALVKGNTLTVEPGIYVIPSLIDKFKSEGKFLDWIDYDRLDAFRSFGGIRIEDNYLITDTGASLLGDPLAKEISDIEELRAEAF